jgi:hypothetical protein
MLHYQYPTRIKKLRKVLIKDTGLGIKLIGRIKIYKIKFEATGDIAPEILLHQPDFTFPLNSGTDFLKILMQAIHCLKILLHKNHRGCASGNGFYTYTSCTTA